MVSRRALGILAATFLLGALVPASANAYRHPVRASYVNYSTCLNAVVFYYHHSGNTTNCKRVHGGRLVFRKSGVRPIDVWSSFDGRRWWLNVVKRR